MHQEILTGVLTLEVVFDVYNRLLQATKTIQTFHRLLKYISDKKWLHHIYDSFLLKINIFCWVSSHLVKSIFYKKILENQ